MTLDADNTPLLEALTTPLLEALTAAEEWNRAYREFEQEMERRFGTDWQTLAPDEIRRATGEIAAARGTPQHGPALGDVAERSILTAIVLRQLDASAPGMERPVPLELLEHVFFQVVEERYGGMTALAAEVGRRGFGLEI